MTTKRNPRLSKLCLIRDNYTCCCCGLEASYAHHIVPLYKNGKDELENMIAICDIDHYFAPDTKEEFEEYVKNGGTKLDLIMGKTVNLCIKYNKNIDLQKIIEMYNSSISTLREAHKIWIEECMIENNKPEDRK